ncbi:hypothetical protein [Mycobacterium sp.]|uniref:hypothetical protein n=1 Tax=Mycobacterium sp. TaxID=1785 RepID=UPI0025E54485|nr:hypothetical protein [Mycobacterium sp.]MBW0012270.1 hypothetical protein [Mycobacterium sp.]
MFTLLVSWLLVACVPGILMLAAHGLGRLERDLAHTTVTATDVDEFLELAEAVDVHTLAREGMPEALEYLHRRQAQLLAELPVPGSYGGRHRPEVIFARGLDGRGEGGFPMRSNTRPRVNPQLRGAIHVNRV